MDSNDGIELVHHPNISSEVKAEVDRFATSFGIKVIESNLVKPNMIYLMDFSKLGQELLDGDS